MMSALAVILAWLAFRRKVRRVIEEREEMLSQRDEMLTQSHQLITRQREEIKDIAERNARLARARLQGYSEEYAPRVYDKFRRAATGQVELTQSDWEQLYAAVATLHPGYMEQMQERVKHLNQKKINVCHLLKLGFTWGEVRDTMNLPRTTAFQLTKELTTQLGDLLNCPGQGRGGDECAL